MRFTSRRDFIIFVNLLMEVGFILEKGYSLTDLKQDLDRYFKFNRQIQKCICCLSFHYPYLTIDFLVKNDLVFELTMINKGIDK